MNSKEILKIYIESNNELYTEIIGAILNKKIKPTEKFNKTSVNDIRELKDYLIYTCKLSQSEIFDIFN
jgi:hypothetical protein